MTDTLTADAAEPISAPEVSADVTDTGAPEDMGADNASLADIIDRAFDSVDDEGGERTNPAQPTDAAPVEDAAATGAQRDPATGRFLPKEQSTPEAVKAAEGEQPAAPTDKPIDAAPDRISPQAKEAWATTPEPVKAEFHRAISEMQQGIETYKASADKYQPLEQFETLAAQYGMNLPGVLADYQGMSQGMASDPISVFDALATRHGYTLEQIASHVLGQEYPPSAEDNTIQQLRKTVQNLQQQVGGVTQTMQTQRESQVSAQVEKFAQDNPRFEELSGEITHMLRTGYASDLPDAYAKAERLNPLPAAPASDVAPLDPVAQTQRGSKSISGAPGSGSNPANRKPAASTRDALDRAFENAGI